MAIVVSALREQEEIIERGMSSFVEVGNALLRIRDDELYREAGFDGFVEYLESKPWGISRDWAYKQMDAAQVSTMVETPTLNERQARELAPLLRQTSPEVVKKVYEDVVKETDGKPTAKRIREKVKATLPKKKPVKKDSAKSDPKVDQAFSAAMKAVETFHRLWSPDAFRGLSPREAEKRLRALDHAVESLQEIRPEIEHRSKSLRLVG